MTAAPLPRTGGPVLSIGAGRALYLGPSLQLGVHSAAVPCLAVGVDAPFVLQVDGHRDVSVRSALIPPRAPHRVVATGETMLFAYLDTTAARAARQRARMLKPHGAFALHHSDEDQLVDLASAGRADDLHRVLEPAPPGVDPRIAAAIDHLSGDCPDSSAEAVAARVSLSPSHFLHTFAAQTGTTFRRYKIWLRMLRVARAVDAGASLTDASVSAGFASPSHFTDTFVATFGLTPSALVGVGVTLVAAP